MRRLATTFASSLLLSLVMLAPPPAAAWQTVIAGNEKDDDGDVIHDVAIDGRGDVIVTGELLMDGGNRLNIEFATAKLAKATGGVIWRTSLLTPRTFDRSRALTLNAAGDVFLTGRLDSGFGIARLSGANGGEAWRRSTKPVDGEGVAIALAANDDPVAAGNVRTNAGAFATDFYVTRSSAATGAELWKLQLTSGSARNVAVDGDGNVLASGSLYETVDLFDLDRCVVVKLNGATGSEIWRHEILGAGPFPDAVCSGLAVASNGDVIIGGFRDVDGFNSETYVARLAKANGNELWRHTSDAALDPLFVALTLDPFGDVIVTGGRSAGEFFAGRTQKLDADTGAQVWENLILVPALFRDGEGTLARAVATDAAGNVGLALQLDDKKGKTFLLAILDGITGGELTRRSFAKKPGFAQAAAFGADGSFAAAGQSDLHWFVANLTASSAGKSLVLQDNAEKPAKRKLQVAVADDAFALGTPGGGGDPRTVGATLQIKNPTSGETQTIALPAANWVGTGSPPGAKGYKYVDKKLTAGPCAAVDLKPRAWSAKCGGDKITFTLDEPAQGSLGATLAIGSQRSCAVFGGEVKKDIPAAGSKAGVFSAKKAPAPEKCP